MEHDFKRYPELPNSKMSELELLSPHPQIKDDFLATVEKVHDGRVFVTSQAGVGSTFGFELPLATPEVVESA